MEIVAILGIVQLVMALVKSGLIGYLEVKGAFEKYKDLEATPENIEALRNELLDAAHVGDAVDDPRIRKILLADGIDPEVLRIN